MAIRQQQREEQAMEMRDALIETQQQQKHKNKKDKKKKKTAKTNHTTEWIREWLAPITQLDGYGRTRTAIGDGITGTTQNTPQSRHAQSLDRDPLLQLPRPK
jgi:hypothetical protein